MKLHGFDCRINKNYATELYFLHKLRNFKDGISFLNIDICLDLFKHDHNPKFRIHAVFLNFTIVEFSIYNRHHKHEVFERK